MALQKGQSHVVFFLTKQNTNPLMTDKYNRGRRFVPSNRIAHTCESIDEAGNVRTIRYVRGQKSIYADEQHGDALHIARNIEKPKFDGGQLMVPTTQTNLLAFLRAHPSNHANQHWNLPQQSARFYEDKPNERAEQYAKLVEKEGDVIMMVMKADFISKILPIARAKGINTERSEAVIRRDVLVFAQRNADEFISLYDDPRVQRLSMLHEALNLGFISVNGQNVGWPEGGTFHSAPMGMTALDSFADVSFDPSYREVIAHISRRLQDATADDDDADIIDKSASDREAVLAAMSAEELFSLASERLIIKKSGAYYTIGATKHNGKAKFVEAMEADEDLRALVIAGLMP